MAGEPGQAFFDEARHQVIAGEVIDDDDRAAGNADAAHLGGEARRVRHDRGDVEREHGVERIVRKFEVLSIHHVQTLDMRKPQALGPTPRLRQHLLGDVDAGHSGILAEMGKRQPGTDADLEDMLARPIVGDAHRRLAPRVKNRAENDVVGAGKQPIGPDRIVQVHRLTLVIMHEAGMQTAPAQGALSGHPR